MPHPLELPRMLRSVVPLVRGQRLAAGGRSIVSKFVALALGRASRRRVARRGSRLMPSLAAVIRALNDLAKPAARLRRIDAVRVNRRSLDVIKFPAGEMRPADFPFFAFAIRRQNERALVCAHQNSYFAHKFIP